MKTVLAAVLATGVLTPVVADRVLEKRASLPLAYVSLQRLFAESVEARAGVAQLETRRQALGREAIEKQKALDAAHQQLVQAGGVFEASKRARLKEEEDRDRADLQQFTQKAQADLQQRQQQVQGAVKQDIATILADIASRRGYQMILNEDVAVVWSREGADLTAEVLQRLNAAAASKGDTKPGDGGKAAGTAKPGK
jgi:Skp family chaperone for outer membrane proteins